MPMGSHQHYNEMSCEQETMLFEDLLFMDGIAPYWECSFYLI